MADNEAIFYILPTKINLPAIDSKWIAQNPQSTAWLIQISSHVMTGNSKAIELVGIPADTPNSLGSIIQRKSDKKTHKYQFQELGNVRR